MHKRFEQLLETLDSLAETGKPDEKLDAHGLLKAWRTAQNVYILVILSVVFCQLGPLSIVYYKLKIVTWQMLCNLLVHT